MLPWSFIECCNLKNNVWMDNPFTVSGLLNYGLTLSVTHILANHLLASFVSHSSITLCPSTKTAAMRSDHWTSSPSGPPALMDAGLAKSVLVKTPGIISICIDESLF